MIRLSQWYQRFKEDTGSPKAVYEGVIPYEITVDSEEQEFEEWAKASESINEYWRKMHQQVGDIIGNPSMPKKKS